MINDDVNTDDDVKINNDVDFDDDVDVNFSIFAMRR